MRPCDWINTGFRRLSHADPVSIRPSRPTIQSDPGGITARTDHQSYSYEVQEEMKENVWAGHDLDSCKHKHTPGQGWWQFLLTSPLLLVQPCRIASGNETSKFAPPHPLVVLDAG